MAKRKRSKRYNLKTYLVYGKYPVGNHTLQSAIHNDWSLDNYLSKIYGGILWKYIM